MPAVSRTAKRPLRSRFPVRLQCQVRCGTARRPGPGTTLRLPPLRSCLQALISLPPPADQRPGRQSRAYFARFQTDCVVPPTVGAGLLNFSSSAVREVTSRF
jgi:hypothetical protein